MRLLGALLLLCAGVSAWLSIGDRMSPLALDLVELETGLGLPLYAPVGTLGVLLLIAGSATRRRPPAPPPAEAAPPSPAVITDGGDDASWVPAVIQRAQALQWEPGAALVLDAAAGVPFELRLMGMPQAAEHRSLQQLARFLAEIPTPPRARVTFSGSTAPADSRHHRVRAALRSAGAPEVRQVLRQGDSVDVTFASSGPCWVRRGRLFIDA